MGAEGFWFLSRKGKWTGVVIDYRKSFELGSFSKVRVLNFWNNKIRLSTWPWRGYGRLRKQSVMHGILILKPYLSNAFSETRFFAYFLSFRSSPNWSLEFERKRKLYKAFKKLKLGPNVSFSSLHTTGTIWNFEFSFH